MTDVSPTPTAPTAAEIAAAQATLAQAQAAATATANANTVVALAPIAAITGPGVANLLTALQANLSTIMTYDMTCGQDVNNAIVVLTRLVNNTGSKYLAAGGVASTT